MKSQLYQPAEIKRIGNQSLSITWKDGHASAYPAAYLRLECPCAECLKAKGERKNPLRIVTGPPADQIALAEMELAGNYALTIAFSDGHASGIFSFEYLREVCNCQICKSDRFG